MNSRFAFMAFAAVAVFLTGCAGKLSYSRPNSQVAPAANTKLVERDKDSVWNSSIPELGKQFFVINNLDKSSGLMNISYSGDPERYIDCGRVTSYVKNARGERTYEFAGAKAQQSYEVMNPSVGLFAIDRRMSLEGRVNLIFEEVSPTSTRVTANTRYVVERKIVARNLANGIPQSAAESVSFNSGKGAFFPENSRGQPTECVSTGALEKEILSAIR